MICYSHYDSPLGTMTMASDGTDLTGLWFDGQKYYPDLRPEYRRTDDLPVFISVRRWLDVYFNGDEPDFTPRIRLESTPFREAVWQILLTIPYGCTVTYSDIAARIANERGISSMSSQAVGGAVGHNPISLIVPCHRVVGSDGSLTGYAGGIEKKLKLLELEGVDPGRFYVPGKR